MAHDGGQVEGTFHGFRQMTQFTAKLRTAKQFRQLQAMRVPADWIASFGME
jgi:hypothetical protein